jgi:hypothetical protein
MPKLCLALNILALISCTLMYIYPSNISSRYLNNQLYTYSMRASKENTASSDASSASTRKPSQYSAVLSKDHFIDKNSKIVISSKPLPPDTCPTDSNEVISHPQMAINIMVPPSTPRCKSHGVTLHFSCKENTFEIEMPLSPGLHTLIWLPAFLHYDNEMTHATDEKVTFSVKSSVPNHMFLPCCSHSHGNASQHDRHVVSPLSQPYKEKTQPTLFNILVSGTTVPSLSTLTVLCPSNMDIRHRLTQHYLLPTHLTATTLHYLNIRTQFTGDHIPGVTFSVNMQALQMMMNNV